MSTTTHGRSDTQLQPGPEAPKRSPRRIGFGARLSSWDVRLSPYLYISPFFLLFFVTGLFPLIYTGYVSLHQWDLIAGQGEFVGARHFIDVLTGDQFWKALRNTVSIFALSTIPQVVLALLIAVLLDTKLRAATLWRMGILIPFVVAPVAVALIFSNLFADRFGLVNAILTGIGFEPVAWHSSALPSHLAIATMVNFRWTGYNALIFLAALQAVPRDLYEQASIDGAGKVRQFFSVTVPLLRPTIIFVVITSTIGGLQIFDEPRMYDQFGRGGSDGQWMTLTIHLYELGWTQSNFGRAAAVAVLLFLIIVIVGLVNFLIIRRISSAEAPR